MGTFVILFLQGLLIGSIISVPVGPVNIMCFNKTLTDNRTQGFKLTLGATFADTIFALIAILGLNSVVGFIEMNRTVFELISGAILITFSIVIILKGSNKTISKQITEINGTTGMLTSFLLTISNPLTILVFIAYLSQLMTELNPTSILFIILFIGGVMAGSMSWFLSLTWLTIRFKSKISNKILLRINTICSLGLTLLGIYMISKNLM